jgi:nucleoid DNA-binding protein
MLTKDQRLELLRLEVGKKYPQLTKPQEGKKMPALTKTHLAHILACDQQLQVGDLRTSRQLRIAGWGTFRIVDRAARTTRNPQTGQQMQVPARKAITFRAAQELQQAVGAGKASRQPPRGAAAASQEATASPKNGRSRRRQAS